jgi:hypothetical protein
MDKATFISVDIEADGPVPGMHSMLSLGAAAFSLRAPDPRKPLVGFSANLETLSKEEWPQVRECSDTMKWWETQPEAWEACRKDPRPPAEVMPEFIAWCRNFKSPLVVIGYPVTFDFGFLYWYTRVYGGLKDGEECPFGFSGLDIKTLASERLGLPYRATTKRRMPKRWFKGAPPHDHVALTDAIGQGVLFVNIMLDGEAA